MEIIDDLEKVITKNNGPLRGFYDFTYMMSLLKTTDNGRSDLMQWKCNIGEKLERKGIKQRELAEAIGATEVSVSRWVNNERIPKATICIQIAKVLDCKVEDLYTAKE